MRTADCLNIKSLRGVGAEILRGAHDAPLRMTPNAEFEWWRRVFLREVR